MKLFKKIAWTGGALGGNWSTENATLDDLKHALSEHGYTAIRKVPSDSALRSLTDEEDAGLAKALMRSTKKATKFEKVAQPGCDQCNYTGDITRNDGEWMGYCSCQYVHPSCMSIDQVKYALAKHNMVAVTIDDLNFIAGKCNSISVVTYEILKNGSK